MIYKDGIQPKSVRRSFKKASLHRLFDLLSELRGPFAAVRITLGALICLVLNSCSTSFLFSGTGNTIQINSGDIPSSGTTGTGIISIPLAQVNLNHLLPTQLLDLVGDGTGKLGQICAATDQQDPNTTGGTSACSCNFKFSSPTAPNQSVIQPVIYHESNLVRCNYSTVIPYNVTSFQISLVIPSSGAASKSVQFKLGTSNGLDPTLATSYQKVSRFLCKGLLTVSYLLDSNIYDPYQSEDPHITYPLDYYTPNFGQSLAYFVNSGDTSNECPAQPDTSSIPILSVDPFNGSNSIDPPPLGQFDRSTFYLASKPTSVFTVPVNSNIAPSVMSNADSQGNFTVAPPLGYGANFVTTGGIESCPNIPIPTGYQWVKVWLFRASLPSRASFIPANTSLSAIACNPGDWNIAPPGSGTELRPIFPSCPRSTGGGQGNSYGPDYGQSLTSPNYLADRVILASVTGAGGTQSQSVECVSLTNSGYRSTYNPNQCNTSSSPKLPGVGCGMSTPEGYGDYWELEIPTQTESTNGFSITPYLGCNRSNDPLNLCNAGHTGNFARPFINNLTPTANFDTNPRSDYLFVVTPTTVTRNDMTQGTALGNQFIPYRYKTATDCSTNGPCDTSQKLTYLPKLDDITITTDPNANDPQRTGIYPICAIQPAPTN